MKKILSVLIIICSINASAQLLGSMPGYGGGIPGTGIQLNNGNILFTKGVYGETVYNVYAGGGFYPPQTPQILNGLRVILKHMDDDRYLAVNYHIQINNAYHDTITICRFLPDGIYDSSFNNNGIYSIPVSVGGQLDPLLHPYDLAVLKDSSLILTYAENDSVGYPHVKALKLTPAGNPDSAFGINGIIILPLKFMEKPANIIATDITFMNIPILEDNDHHIYFGGMTNNFNFHPCLIRYNDDGIFDNAYGFKTGVGIGDISRLILDYSGDILAMGMTYDNAWSAIGWFVKKYKPDGTINGGFGVNGESLTPAYYLNNGFLQPDGKIVLFGQNAFQGNLYGQRLNANGTLDNTWSINTTYQQCGNYSQENFVFTSLMSVPGQLVYVVGFNNLCESATHVRRELLNPCGNGNAVSSLPVLTASNLNVCLGAVNGDSIFIAGSLNGASYWEYYTNLNPAPVQVYGNSFIASPNASTTYYVRGAGYCSGIGPVDSITINVFAPTSSFTNSTICINLIPYVWNGLTIDSQGVYNVIFTNANGCDSVATLDLNISVCGLCQNTFTANWSPFTDSLVESQAWITTSGTVLIPLGANVKFDANVGGYVRLNPGFKADSGSVFVAQAYNGCTAGAPQLPQAGKVFKENPSAAADEIILYPNPTSGLIHIRHEEKLTDIQIFDMVGKLIINQKCAGETQTNIDLSHLPNGVYHVKAAGYNSIKVVKND